MAKKSKAETVVTAEAGQSVNVLTPEVLEQLGLDEQQRTALMEYASARLAEGEKTPQRPKFELFNIEPGTPVTLAELIALDATPIPNAGMAMRKINKDNVESLMFAYESGSDVPPIEIVGSTWGMIVLNGYHRQDAMEELVKREFLTPDGKLAPDGKEQYERALTQFVIEYKPYHGQNGYAPTEEDILNYATFANLKNGLQVSKENRSRLALWYQERERAAGRDISYRKLAPMFGVSFVAISRQAARDLAKAHPELAHKGRLPADVVVSELDRAEIQGAMAELAEKEASKADPLETACKQLVKTCAFIYNQVDSADDFTLYLQDFIKTSDDFYATQFVTAALQGIQEPEVEPAAQA